MSNYRLRRLADFRSRLSNLSDFGTWQSDPNSLGYVSLGETGKSFVDMAYEAGWVDQDFSWTEWHASEEAVRLRHPEAIETATELQMVYILTTLIRGDRFSEGLLLGALDSGVILALSERASSLIGEKDEFTE